MPDVLTPCLGACSTAYGDDYCRGCKRHVDEVTDWVSYKDEEKFAVIQRLDQQLFAASKDLVWVEDESLLAAQVKKYHIRCDFTRAPIYWLFCLLREGRDKMHHLEYYGIKLKTGLTPVELFEQWDQAFYRLASGC